MWWRKLGAQPQITGDRPAQPGETIVVARLGGRKRWNGGGKPGYYEHVGARERNSGEAREHTTQKPETLMVELVDDFTEPGEIVYDFTMGFATTGIGCLRARGGPRRFVGVEMSEAYCEKAAKRLDAELSGSTYHAARAGQVPLFGGA